MEAHWIEDIEGLDMTRVNVKAKPNDMI